MTDAQNDKNLPVTWAERALHAVVNDIGERVTKLEEGAVTVPPNTPPAAITVEGLAKAFVAKDNHRECPFCDKNDWQDIDEILHSEHCPFAIAYQVLAPPARGEVDNGIDWALPNDPPSPTMPFEEVDF